MDSFWYALLWTLVGLYFYQVNASKFSKWIGLATAVMGTLIMGVKACMMVL